MLIIMIIAARSVIRRLDVPQALGATMFSVGLIAIGLLIPGEIAGVIWVVQEYLTGFATLPGIISLVMFLLFAAMPTLVTLTIGISVIRTGLK